MSLLRSRLSPVLLSTLLVVGGASLAACWGGSGQENKPAAGASVTNPPETMVGTHLATVNGAPVGSLAFDALAQRQTPADGKAFSADEKKSVLDQAIVDELLFQEAFHRGLYHDPKVRKILVNLLLRAEVYDNVHNEDFTEDQLKAFFESHKEEFVVPEKIQIKRIFLQIGPDMDQAAAEKLGADLAAKIKADPESFTELAQTHSKDPFARRGGDLGYLARDGKPGVPSDIVQRAFNMATGEVSAPFLAAGGINVIYVANRRERVERTYEQMRGSVLRRMKNDKFE
ncbi:MAG TPA: peptidylprolyl isomerase, partial [Myxococcota bacterium]|nr:peptidylprolyl isomerase [Myxococcota bacterium]